MHSEVGFRFRDSDYSGEETTGFAAFVIEKTEEIASLVRLTVTPLTVMQAEDFGIVTDLIRGHALFPESTPYSPNRAQGKFTYYTSSFVSGDNQS